MKYSTLKFFLKIHKMCLHAFIEELFRKMLRVAYHNDNTLNKLQFVD